MFRISSEKLQFEIEKKKNNTDSQNNNVNNLIDKFWITQQFVTYSNKLMLDVV